MKSDKKMAIAIFIAAILVFTVSVATISATVYDFKDTINNKAYEGTDDSRPPTTVPPDYEAELSTSNYEKINTSDGNIANYTNSTGHNFHRFVFKINDCIESILQINVTYEGYGSATMGSGVYLYIWNYTSSSWEEVGSHTNGTAAEIISKTYMNGLSNYINATGHLQLLAQTTETQSCPFLYVWDGTRYHFVTDTNSGGRIGARYPRNPWPEDYVKIDGSELTAESGTYRLELAEDQDEITYLDSVRLIAVDHQPGVEMYSTPRINNSKYSDVLPYTYTIKNPRVPVSATDESGRDILPIISQVDRKYTDAQQYDFDTVTIDFGDLSGAKKIKLLYNAYVNWPSGAGFAGRHERPYVEVINEAGEWERVSEDNHFHNAQAKPITTVLDITDWFKTDDYRIRINNGFEVHIDYIAVDTSEDEAVSVTEWSPTAANLYWKGVSVQTTPDGNEPLIPDFYTTVDLSGFSVWTGNFTRYGDVLPVVTETDEKFVIMHAGDSVSIAFAEVPVPDGMERDYYLVSDAYYKDKGNSVDPLPFHDMSEYPYPENESYPYDAEHIEYLEEYNTREFGSMSGEEGHHTIFTDYVKVEIIAKLPALEVNKTVLDPETGEWVKSLNASMGETLQFNCTIHNSGGFNLTQIRFWDILDCSLNYSGNATLTNASGGEKDITPPCMPAHCFKPKVLHPYNLSWDPYNSSLGTEKYVELCPDIGHNHTLTDWEDNGDGRISYSDQIYLLSVPGPYHVENVPYTLLVNDTAANKSMYIDSLLDYESVNLSAPNGTEWNCVCCCKDSYHLENWTNVDGGVKLKKGDYIVLRNKRTDEVANYSVEEVTIDLVVSKEWEIDDLIIGDPDGLILEPCQTITIEYNATVVRCGVDNNTFRAKGWYGLPDLQQDAHTWYYSNEDVVTITVPCPTGDATDPTGLAKEVYMDYEDVYATGSGFDPSYNGTMNIHIFDDYDWYDGLNITTDLPTPYASLFNVPIDANGNVGPIKIWNKEDTFVGEFDMFFDADGDGIYTPFIDVVDNFHDPGFIIVGAVPLLTPIGIAALVGLLTLIATSTILRRRKKR